MSLLELEKDEQGIIIDIHAPKTLLQRFHMFGIRKNQIITLKACTWGRQNIEIEVDSTLVALRNEEAKKIEIKKL